MRKLADRELRLIARPKRKDFFCAQSIPFFRPDRKTKFLTCRFQSASYNLTPFAALFPHFSPSLPAARRREAKGRWRHLSDRRRRKKESPRASPRALRVWGWVIFFTKQKRSRRNAKGAAPKNFLLLFSFFPCTCIILHFSKEKRPMTQKALLPPQEEISSGGRRLRRRRPRIFPRKNIRQGASSPCKKGR